MDNRKQIGIIFDFEKKWLGGIYYLINIIKSLNHLKDEEKPLIKLFYNPDLSGFIKEIEYPFIDKIAWEFPNVTKGYIKSFITGKNIFIEKILNNYDLNGLYPVNNQPVRSKTAINKNTKIIAWYADLQHKFYPEFFTRNKLFFRDIKIKLLLKNSTDFIVSSNDVKNHFHKFYKIRENLNLKVLPFVSIIDDFSFDNINELRQKYSLKKEYYMVSNQFYKHKNHIIVLKALSQIAEKDNVHVVMTGRMSNTIYPEFIEELKNEISTHNLGPKLSMLDVIPRQDQLCLMKYAKAVIQPSLFEGWSTVIEDAKSLQVPVIASNTLIHQEQLKDKGTFFSPENPDELADILDTFFLNNSNNHIYDKYNERVKKFAENFMRLF